MNIYEKNKIKINFYRLFICFSFLSFSSVFSQNSNHAFDSLANEINRLSIYKKTKSFELLDSLYKMAYKSPDNSLLIAHCLYEESTLNKRQGIIDTLLTHSITERIVRKNISVQERAVLYFALGTCFEYEGRYSDAFEYWFQALELFKHLKNNQFIARTLNSLGGLCSSINLLSLADYYHSEALLFISSDSDSHDFYFIKNNMIRLLFLRGKEEAAIDSMLKLIDIAEKENREEILFILYLNAGSYVGDNNSDKALSFFTKMQTLDFENSRITSILFSNLGWYNLINNNDLINAYKYYKDSQNIMEQINNLEHLPHLYANISLVFEQQNILDSALYYSKKSQEVASQLSSNTVAIETHQKYITTFLEAKENELIIAEQKNALKQRHITIIIIVSVSSILLVLLYLLYVHQQKLRKIAENKELTATLEYEKEKLDLKKREISSYSMLVSNKNQLLNQIRELNSQIFDKKENIIKITKKIDDIIKCNLNTDDEWKNFKLHFEAIHPRFFEKIRLLCSDFTEENLKLCAYIKMGLTTKQIATMFNVVPNTIISNRHRLKKKLKLSEEESLSDFIVKL